MFELEKEPDEETGNMRDVLLKFLKEKNKRLSQPKNCPDSVYSLMNK